MWRRERFLASVVLVTCVLARAGKAEVLGSVVRPAVGFSDKTNAAGQGEPEGFNVINGVEDRISAGWLRGDKFEKIPVDFSTNFAAASQYWTEVAGAGSFRNSLKQFPALNPEIADLYTRFSKGTLADYDFSGSGAISTIRDLQLAIWNMQDKSDYPVVKLEEAQPHDWLSTSSGTYATGASSIAPGGAPMAGGGDSNAWFGGGGGGGSGSGGGGGSGGADGQGTSTLNATKTGQALTAVLTRAASAAGPTAAVAPIPTPLWGGLVLMLAVAGFRICGSTLSRQEPRTK